MIALVDCNNFYASCERLFRPELNGRPIVVLSNNDGCVIARSNEAKDLGIPMGAPAHEWQDVLVKNKVAIFSSNYALYGDISRRIMNILGTMAPDIEVYSIDEAFLDLGNMTSDLKQLANSIKDRVHRWTGIPVSIGIAPTKTLAKAANRISKTFPELNSVHIMDTDEARTKALRWLSNKHIWGIGAQHAKTLDLMHIQSAWDFCQQADAKIRKHFTVVGLRTKKELEGISCIEFEDMPPSKKAIACTRSFGSMLTDLESISEAVSSFAEACAIKLRAQKSCAVNMMLFIHTNGFRNDLPQYKRNAVLHLPVASNSSIELCNYAGRMLKVLFQPGYQYKKAGIIITDLVPEDQIQMNMFDTLDRKKHARLMRAMDALNEKDGRGTVFLSSQGTTRHWKLRQEKKSQHYTTQWKDILNIGPEEKE